MLIMVAVWGAAFAGFAVAPGLWLTLGLLAIAGAADTFTVVFRGAMVRRRSRRTRVPRPGDGGRLRGRGIAAASDLGNLEAGALGSLTSPGHQRADGRPW